MREETLMNSWPVVIARLDASLEYDISYEPVWVRVFFFFYDYIAKQRVFRKNKSFTVVMERMNERVMEKVVEGRLDPSLVFVKWDYTRNEYQWIYYYPIKPPGWRPIQI